MDINKDRIIRCILCNADAKEVVEFHPDGEWSIIRVEEIQNKLDIIRKIVEDTSLSTIMKTAHVREILDS